MSESSESLSNLLREERTFPPSADFAAAANVGAEMYDVARADRLAFWDEQASRLHWDAPWSQTLDWSDAPFARWFVDGRLNVAFNCVDRHVANGLGDRVADTQDDESVSPGTDDGETTEVNNKPV